MIQVKDKTVEDELLKLERETGKSRGQLFREWFSSVVKSNASKQETTP